MPCRSYQDRHGNTHYSDTFFPLNANDRTAINEAVLSAYQQELEQSEAEGLDESEDASEGWLLRCKVAGVFRQSA